MGTGYSNLVVLRLMAELGLVGILALWIACLIVLRSGGRLLLMGFQTFRNCC